MARKIKPKGVRSFRFDMETLEKMDELKETYGSDTYVQLMEYLIDQAHMGLRHKKVEDIGPANLLDLLAREKIHLENKNNVLWMNGKTSHYNAAKYDVHAKLHSLGFQHVEKLFQEIIEYLIPGYLKREYLI